MSRNSSVELIPFLGGLIGSILVVGGASYAYHRHCRPPKQEMPEKKNPSGAEDAPALAQAPAQAQAHMQAQAPAQALFPPVVGGKVVHDIRVMPDGSIRITTMQTSTVSVSSSLASSECSGAYEKIAAGGSGGLVQRPSCCDPPENRAWVTPNTPPTTPCPIRASSVAPNLEIHNVEVDYETDYEL